MFSTIAGAMPLVGSSIRMRRRGSTTARAIESICFCPPESTPAGWFQNVFKAGKKPKIQSSRAAGGGPSRAARIMFSRTVRSAKTPMLSGT